MFTGQWLSCLVAYSKLTMTYKEEGRPIRREDLQGGGKTYKGREDLQRGGKTYKEEGRPTTRREDLQGGGKTYKEEGRPTTRREDL